jgi:hypothetical protein
LVAQEFRLFERAWFNLQQWQQADQLDPNSLRLGNYEVEIEAKVIAGLDDDVSALTYDPDRNSLFTVTNQKAQLIELNREVLIYYSQSGHHLSYGGHQVFGETWFWLRGLFYALPPAVFPARGHMLLSQPFY